MKKIVNQVDFVSVNFYVNLFLIPTWLVSLHGRSYVEKKTFISVLKNQWCLMIISIVIFLYQKIGRPTMAFTEPSVHRFVDPAHTNLFTSLTYICVETP